MWPSLSIAALAALAVLAVVHLRWRSNCARQKQAAEEELTRLRALGEQSALQAQTRQQAVFDSMAEGLLLLDQAGRVELANRAFNELFGVTADLRSRTVLEALRSHELADLVRSLGAQKQVLGHELKVVQPRARILQVNAAAIITANNERHGTVLVFHDLTRLKELEGARQEFVANVSHELRTPLSLIKGYVETLLDGAKDNPEVATKFLNTIARNAARLQFLIEVGAFHQL